MEMVMYDLNQAETLIKRLFKKNPNRSISGTFKIIRKQSRFFPFGDYPILSIICRIIGDLKIKKPRQQILYAFNFSAELKDLTRGGKSILVDQLVKHNYIQSMLKNNAPKILKNDRL